ncbi:hypothetical protein C3B47_04655 [Flavobacterium columnare]|uniref:hypothetical protein n=1 Tax=Flavobacterium columnare TaxID=996 RepID=UPI0018964661|nr:hypothetical protein [Flavobacterium columnare]MBF6652188.1 hypothetical protein [Flavobacterium columnare]
MKKFWEKEVVKNYLIRDLFDVDVVVEKLGSCPNDEDYKIKRKYFYIEFVGGDEPYEIFETTKEEYEKHKEDDNNEFDYRTELNYEEFIDKFWFDTFEQILFGYCEPNQQLDFILCVKDTFFELNFEGQAKMFLKSVINGLNQLIEELNYLLSNNETIHSVKINKIQEIVIKHYSGSYLNAKKKIINSYKFIYPEIEKEFSDIDDVRINTKPTREEILKKLIGENKNIAIFEKYEEKLKTYGYLSMDYEWKKKPANLSRFYTHCEKQKVFKSHFIGESRGIDYLRQLYGFEDGRSIDSYSKRIKQITKTTINEFDFLDLK